MKINLTYLLLVSTLTLSSLSSCLDKCEQKEKIIFGGTVQTVSGAAIEGVLVQVNADRAKTDENGSFKIAVDANQISFLVSAERFGYGLFSRSFDGGFEDKKIVLTQGTVVEFDPTVDNTIMDSNSNNNIALSALLELDTSLLFNTVPRVYDHTGKLIDLGYPDEVKGIFDYVKTPRTTRRGMSMRLRANSLRNASGNPPPAGKKLKAAVTTVDFFNPDGMPGDFTVRFKGDPRRFDIDTARMREVKSQQALQQAKSSDMEPGDSTETSTEMNSTDDDALREQLAYMESFGAATIDISDGEEPYQLTEGMTATVTIPVYSIRQEKNEFIPPVIPLLHYNESDGVWEVTGQGILNEAGDAYVAEVGHFSVVNFDMVKTGDSKCFKIRQMLVNGANDNTIVGGGTGAFASYRAHLLVPETATSVFRERPRVIDEATGCVPVLGTSLHGVSRLDNTIPYIVAVFSQDGVGATDTLNIAIVSPDPVNSIPAETAVADLGDCTTSTCMAADITNCETTNDAVDLTAGNYTSSTCNTCWQPNCAVIPFDNSGADPSVIVGVPMGGNDINVKWVKIDPTITSLSVTVHADDVTNPLCGSDPVLVEIQNLCNADCSGISCRGGSIIYNGAPGSTVVFRLNMYSDLFCDGGSFISSVCSGPVTVL